MKQNYVKGIAGVSLVLARIMKWFIPYGVLCLRKKALQKISENKILKEIKENTLLPSKVRMDVSTVCQLNCCDCYMRTNENAIKVTKIGFLRFKNFKRFIDNNPFIRQIEISNSGEIFLNPDIFYIIKYAYENNVLLTARNGVNFNSVSNEVLEALVKYKFHSIVFSIDGASQEIYSIYRRNGNFDMVINNIKKLNRFKKQYDSTFPEMIYKFILFKHNVCDIAGAKMLAKELNMRIVFVSAWGDGRLGADDFELIKNEIEGSEYQRLADFEASVCRQMFDEPTINWDGRFLGCCINGYYGDFGINIFKIGIKKALRNKAFVYAKGMLLGKLPPLHIIPCAKCYQYKQMLESGKYFTN